MGLTVVLVFRASMTPQKQFLTKTRLGIGVTGSHGSLGQVVAVLNSCVRARHGRARPPRPCVVLSVQHERGKGWLTRVGYRLCLYLTSLLMLQLFALQADSVQGVPGRCRASKLEVAQQLRVRHRRVARANDDRSWGRLPARGSAPPRRRSRSQPCQARRPPSSGGGRELRRSTARCRCRCARRRLRPLWAAQRRPSRSLSPGARRRRWSTRPRGGPRGRWQAYRVMQGN
jgi:hypothetical protein